MARHYLVAATNREIKQKEQVNREPLQQSPEPEGSEGVDSTEELVQIPIFPYFDRWFLIGKSLSTED